MYGLDEGVDLGFLVGAQVQQVAIGEQAIQFNFDGARSISIECSFVIRDGDTSSAFENAPSAAAAAVSLLGLKIRSEHHDASGALSLDFDNGFGLEVADHSTEFESYQVSNGQHLYVV